MTHTSERMTQSTKLDPVYLRASPALELKFAGAEADAGVIEGHASHFGGEPDSYGDLIAQGSYTRTLSEHSRDGSMPAMLWQHDTSIPVGRWTEMRQDSRGLYVRGQLNLATEPGQRAHSHLKAGDLRGLSIGFTIYPDGYKFNSDGTRTLTSIDLKEVSLVTLPAQRRAAVTGVKASFNSRAELKAILRECLPGRAVEKLLSDGWSAFERGDDEDPEQKQLAAVLKAATLEIRSIKGQ